MTNLVNAQPTDIIHRGDLFSFYFGVKAANIHRLPDDSYFQVVYSPRGGDNWQMATYQLINMGNGISVIERRDLEPDEMAYFERLTVI